MISIKEKILGLYASLPKELSTGELSSINKSPVDCLQINQHSIGGDQPYDQKHHGGDMRVVHHISEESYSHFKKCFPDIAEKFKGGSFGENIYTKNLNYKDLCIGDIFSVGDVKLELTVCRRPCATINKNYQDKRVLKEVISSANAGWFYKVIEPGEIKVGEDLILTERIYPKLTLKKLFDQGYGTKAYSDRLFLKACLTTGLMDKGWLPKLEKIFN